MTKLATIGYDEVLRSVSPELAIERVREGFRRYALREWSMPSKVYLQSPPNGDFRAMPARGDGLAIVKWVTSFPGNSERHLPVVYGTIIVSDAQTGAPRALVDGRSVTALRTGAAAAVATSLLARGDAKSVGLIGSGLHGAWVARCLKASGYSHGVCFDLHAKAAQSLARELGWSTGTREEALACEIVCTVTPGYETVVWKDDIRPGTHYNAVGADGPGKAEFETAALLACDLYCDEWDQASHGGELTAVVAERALSRGDVTEIGWLLTGASVTRSERATVFDSTGLAVQDLAICAALIELLDSGQISAGTVEL